MKMLRDFVYTLEASLLPEILQRFDVALSDRQDSIALTRFEVMTPDSFMWRLLIDEGVYYLYAEDYVPSLEHVRRIFDGYIGRKDWSLVPVRQAAKFEAADPVKGAEVYAEPEGFDELARYATDSGFDWVFLARSGEDFDLALMSEYAARGFGS